jgi:CubicO group peptidase (beta-lactamase class C family)
VLILKDGNIRFEQYWSTGGPDETWLSMSVAKSFISALVGIAIDQGHIRSIQDPVTDYAPELGGSAYDGVAIKDILQMSSGAAWNEDYGDPESDINRFGRIFALGGSMNEFAATLQGEFKPGTYNRYNSTDTQVLGMVLTNAVGRSINDYMTEMLWHPLGAENQGWWLTDSDGMEMAFGGLNATAKDYAKLGELYRLGGALDGRQIVPAAWVQASVTPDAAHLMPGDNPASDWPLGYGYQWWIPGGDKGEFMAVGVYNQFIYIAPESKTVIVKLSANSAYGTPDDAMASSEFETIEFFRAVTQ